MMKRLLPMLLVACGGGGDKPADAPPVDAPPAFNDCDADPASFVRQSFLAITGRRPKSQDEVQVYVDLYNQAAKLGDDPKQTVAYALTSRPEFTERWVDTLMDAMHVQRVDIQTEAACWDHGQRTTIDAGLATAVRDQRATATGDGKGGWTMVDLARSAIALDDISPVYRAQIFSMVYHPIPAANVDDVHAELARRDDFGTTFDSGFLHRDIVCLGCHNSEHSVTDNDDPALDRFWPVPGLPERGIYGDSVGVDPDRAHAMFRVDNFDDAGHDHPWGWNAACGEFHKSAGTDIAGVDAKLADISGQTSTVYDLEASLAKGFDALRGNTPPIGPDGSIADPDTALAWLVTLKITEDVWRQATGTNLTIANYFPRNQASSDLLYSLATTFTQSKFSLRALLAAIVASDYFDRKAPEYACGAGPYTYPNVFDPWVISDPDPAKRLNGPGDAIQAVSPRTLITATNAALEWPPPPAATRFPDYGEPGCEDLQCVQLGGFCAGGACCDTYHAACQQGGLLPAVELPFERGVGMFLRNSERGFAGLDFEGRLIWEDRYGACARPAWAQSDFIDALATAGAADSTATAADAISALKDRLTGEPAIGAGAEHDALTAIVGDLDAPASAVTGGQLRQVCAALLASPQFLLQGLAGKGGDRPKLTPMDAGYDAVCADLAATGIGVTGRVVTCMPGAIVFGTGAARAVVRTAPAGTRGTITVPHGLPPRRTPAPLATPAAMRHVPAHANP